MTEIIEASEENRIYECFGVGTAAVVSPVKEIGYRGKTINVPLDPSNPSKQIGPLAERLFKNICDIQYGRAENDRGWSIIVPET